MTDPGEPGYEGSVWEYIDAIIDNRAKQSMTGKRAFDALLDRLEDAVEHREWAKRNAIRSAVLAAYDAAAGREAPAVAPTDEFNKAGGDLVVAEHAANAYNWFNDGWYARGKYVHPAPKADESKAIAEVHSGQLRWLVPDDDQPSNCLLYAHPAKADAAADVVAAVLDLFERCAARLCDQNYCNGYREACAHIAKALAAMSREAQ